jgi:hypothetical protein
MEPKVSGIYLKSFRLLLLWVYGLMSKTLQTLIILRPEPIVEMIFTLYALQKSYQITPYMIQIYSIFTPDLIQVE